MQLAREVSLLGAVFMGLGSILGSGVFVTLGLAAGVTGWSMPLALLLAGVVATCNGMSTAQLAASIPRSGGTYEYGYELLSPSFGFAAGILFLAAKSASAATAALGFGYYFVEFFDLTISSWLVSVTALLLLGAIALAGIQKSARINTVIVSLTILSLLVFVLGLLPKTFLANTTFPNSSGDDFLVGGFSGFAEATALLFVAYTGYGRVATLGAEIREPEKNIPKAVILTLGISFLFYALISWTSLALVGPKEYASLSETGAASLLNIAQTYSGQGLRTVIAMGALTALLGVLFNLILGLSRVVFAMAGRGDLPARLSQIHSVNRAPSAATVLVIIVIFALVSLKDISLAWSFSAFTVLSYYGLTNAAALRLPAERRLYPRFLAWLGLFSCLSLAFFISYQVILSGLILLSMAFFLRNLYKRWIS
ncbi:MAG: APC family permease [Oligoflexus sp.]